MRQILPRITLSGTCDATGALTIVNQLKSPSAFFALIYVAIQVSAGSPSWAILAGTKAATGSPLVYGTGAQVMLGPFVLWPGELAIVQITGAVPGATVLGSGLGWMADDPAELLGSTPITTALATPLTPVPVSGAVSILGPVSISGGNLVSLLSQTGALEGDVTGTAATQNPDSATEAINTSGGRSQVAGVIATFKKNTTIAQVGQVGALAVAAPTAASITPAFGQATSAGNLLVAWVAGASNADFTESGPAGWVKAVSSFSAGGASVALWYKPNCGAGEVAPTFNATGITTPDLVAQLAEFSGALAAPLDQTGSLAGVIPPATQTVTAAAKDAATGELVLAGFNWLISTATATFSDTLSNGAVVVEAGNTGNLSRPLQSDFFYGLTPPNLPTAPIGVAPWVYDAFGAANPALGNQASVVLAATPGKRYIVTMLDAVIDQRAGAQTGSQLSLLDGATTIFPRSWDIGAVAGTVNQYSETGLAIPCTVGNSCTWQQFAGVAGVSESVAIGAYLR